MTTDERLEQFSTENIRQFGFDAFTMLEHAQYHLSGPVNPETMRSSPDEDSLAAINLIDKAMTACWRANIGQL